MILKRVRAALSECHIDNGPTFQIFKDAEPKYILDRCVEELKLAQVNYSKMDVVTILKVTMLVIQLLAMLRAKKKLEGNKDESVQADS